MNQMNAKPHNRARFYCLLMLLLGLITIRYSLQVDIPRVVFLGLIAVIVMFGDRNEILAMCICCIPLHESIDFFYAVVICLATYLLKFFGKIRVNLTVFPILLMVFWELLHCFGESFSLVEYLVDCIPLLVLAIIMWLNKSDFDYTFITRAFALATAIICVSLLVKLLYVADFNFLLAFTNLQRLGLDSEETKNSLTVTGGELNPNSLGVLCVLATTGLMQLRTVGRGHRGDMFLIVTLLVFGTLTSSRTYLVCLALMAVLLLFGQRGSIIQKFRFLAAMVFVLLFALVLLYLFFPGLMEFFYGRFLVEDISTGRMELLVAYQDFITSSLKVTFFGVGFHDFGNKMMNVYNVAGNVPHNGIQELVIGWGLPGLLMFLALLLTMALRSRKLCKKQNLLNYIPLIIILAKAQAGQMLASAYTMLAFSYAYMSMCEDFTPRTPNVVSNEWVR